MIFEVHIPGSPLDEFVENFIFFDDFRPDHLIERFLPDGNVEVIIDLLDDPEYIYDNESLERKQACRHGWASGIRTTPISIPAGDGASKLVVVFRKGMAHPFFPVSMSEFSDTVVDAGTLKGVLNISLAIFGICFAVMALFTFLPPIVLTGLVFVSLVVSRIAVKN